MVVDKRQMACREVKEPVADLKLSFTVDPFGDIPLDGVEPLALVIEGSQPFEIDQVPVRAKCWNLEVDNGFPRFDPVLDLDKNLQPLVGEEVGEVMPSVTTRTSSTRSLNLAYCERSCCCRAISRESRTTTKNVWPSLSTLASHW
jgi:hypothetical protein